MDKMWWDGVHMPEKTPCNNKAISLFTCHSRELCQVNPQMPHLSSTISLWLWVFSFQHLTLLSFPFEMMDFSGFKETWQTPLTTTLLAPAPCSLWLWVCFFSWSRSLDRGNREKISRWHYRDHSWLNDLPDWNTFSVVGHLYCILRFQPLK